MPSVSRQQQKLMHGLASGSIKPRPGLPSKQVAREFAAADHQRGAKKLPTNVGKGIVQGKPARSM